jgi:hypothetical protein
VSAGIAILLNEPVRTRPTMLPRYAHAKRLFHNRQT